MSKPRTLRSTLTSLIPWAITSFALYAVLRDVEWNSFLSHIASASRPFLFIAFICTVGSYLLRAFRWIYLFPAQAPTFQQSYRVLILGFFFNNILPARAGELVRAHLGSSATGESRALVLATIASERLIDGLTISFFLALSSVHLSNSPIGKNLSIVAWLFFAASIGIAILLSSRSLLKKIVERCSEKFPNRVLSYCTDKGAQFFEGLRPLSRWPQILWITLLSFAIWGIEILVYYSICHAYDADLSLSQAVIFMVTVNFVSLIPSAPGGIGVIEYATSSVLVSLGVEFEKALAMVITQHTIQYLVVGLPGIWSLLTSKKTLSQVTTPVEIQLGNASAN